MKEKFNTYKDIVASLILKVRDSSQSAFEELLKLYDPLITSLVSSFAKKTVVEQDAEDFRQELIVAFYNSVLSFDLEQNEVSFGLYTKICMSHTLATQLRALKKRNENPVVELPDDEVLHGMGEENSIEKELIEREAMKELNEKIADALSPFELKVWRMYIAECSSKEMAETFGINEKSINNAVYRIRHKLKSLFIK